MVDYSENQRLIPGVTHSKAELHRHESTYNWWRDCIEHDIDNGLPKNLKSIRILDLGCGVGFGCAILASIPKAEITGIDVSARAIEYAKEHYSLENITYEVADIADYIKGMKAFDYVVSRHCIECVPDGFDLLKKVDYKRRMMIDVPYNEKEGNDTNHLFFGIDERWFNRPAPQEFLYQDLRGHMYNMSNKPRKPNTIMALWYDVKKLDAVDPKAAARMLADQEAAQELQKVEAVGDGSN